MGYHPALPNGKTFVAQKNSIKKPFKDQSLKGFFI